MLVISCPPQVGAANPNSGTALSTACQALGDGALSPEAALCGQMVSNIDTARAALQPGARGAPSPEVIAAAVAETVADCEQLPYAFNASMDCDSAERLPAVSFVIGGRGYPLAPLQYAARVSARCALCVCKCVLHAVCKGFALSLQRHMITHAQICSFAQSLNAASTRAPAAAATA